MSCPLTQPVFGLPVLHSSLKGSEQITCAKPMSEQRSLCEWPSISLVTVRQLLWGEVVATTIALRRPAPSRYSDAAQSAAPERQVKRKRLKICLCCTHKQSVCAHTHTLLTEGHTKDSGHLFILFSIFSHFFCSSLNLTLFL